MRKETDLGEYGMAIFAEVSSRYPASAISQGAAIAQVCRRDGMNSEEVRDAIASRPDIVSRIAQTATLAHRAHGKAIPIDSLSVLMVLCADFEVAQRVSILDSSDLDEILRRYHSPATAKQETALGKLVTKLVAKAERSRRGPTRS